MPFPRWPFGGKKRRVAEAGEALTSHDGAGASHHEHGHVHGEGHSHSGGSDHPVRARGGFVRRAFFAAASAAWTLIRALSLGSRETRVGVAVMLSFVILVSVLISKKGMKDRLVKGRGDTTPVLAIAKPSSGSAGTSAATPGSEEKRVGKDGDKPPIPASGIPEPVAADGSRKEAAKASGESVKLTGAENEPSVLPPAELPPAAAPTNAPPLPVASADGLGAGTPPEASANPLLPEPGAAVPPTAATPPLGSETVPPTPVPPGTAAPLPMPVAEQPPPAQDPATPAQPVEALGAALPPVVAAGTAVAAETVAEVGGGAPAAMPPTTPPTAVPTEAPEANPLLTPAGPSGVPPTIAPGPAEPAPAGAPGGLAPAEAPMPPTVTQPAPAEPNPTGAPVGPSPSEPPLPSVVAEAAPAPGGAVIPVPVVPIPHSSSSPSLAPEPAHADAGEKRAEIPNLATPPATGDPVTEKATATTAAAVQEERVALPLMGRSKIRDDDLPERETTALAPSESSSSQDVPGTGVEPVPHIVERGENFWTISRLYYGSGRFYRALWKANSDVAAVPEAITVGMTIRIPAPEALDKSMIDPARGAAASSSRGTSARATQAVSKTNPRNGEVGLPRADLFAERKAPAPIPEEDPEVRYRPNRPVYKVRSRETLRSIARDVLGDSHRYKEILELNRDSIDDPYNLVPGQILELPDDAESGRRSARN